MNQRALSLRIRLLVLILVPLIVIASFAGYWRFTIAKKTSEEIFDRTLIALTLAVSRDVAISGGDALSPTTRDLMRDATDGEVFYHVHGPDGVFVTGYAYPPKGPPHVNNGNAIPTLYEATYKGEKVRVSQLTEFATVEGITGNSTVTVWQETTAREAFARNLALRAAFLMGLLIVTVFAVVWFGINLGLKPLDDLQDAIKQRTSDDLSTIRRKVPREVQGIVATINSLFKQVSDSIASRDRFISNAAHQLRNPIAGIGTLAEATRDAKTPEDTRLRAGELAGAAKHAGRLAQQLLSYERIRASPDDIALESVDLNRLVQGVCERNATRILEKGLEFSFQESPEALTVHCNPVLLSEAVENLVDNSIVHGGDHNSSIDVIVGRSDKDARVIVKDSGQGIPKAQVASAFDRFAQLKPGEGSGLGLSIVQEIVRKHSGDIHVGAAQPGPGLEITISLAAQ